tara:strand:+ start:1084 stop:1629 length:546 start_codon:yes stop_codon:yes gene_type:complete
MLQLNGKTLRYGKAFVHDGMQYPSNWLALTSLEEKQAIGIVEVPDAPVASWDERFYWGVGNPKDLDQLKEAWTARVKQAAGSMLRETDWYVIRQAENSAAVPAEVLTRRGEIRTLSNEKETAIAACEDVAALAEYVTGSAFTSWEPAPEPEPEPTPEPTPEPEATPEPTPAETPEETPSEE